MASSDNAASVDALIKTAAPTGISDMSTDVMMPEVVIPKIQKSFAHQIDLPPSNDGLSECYQGCANCFGTCFGYIGMIPCCGCCSPFRTVEQGFVGLISRFGRYYKSVDPGLWRINPLTESILSVEIRIQIEDIPRQAVMSRDNVLINIDSVLFWEVVEPYTATFLVADVRKAIIERTQTTLRHVIGARTLQDCIENRESVAHEIQEIIAGPQKPGVSKSKANSSFSLHSMLIKDFQFSVELQETLSSAAKQKRVGEAKIILAQAEVESAKLMREASDILNTPAAMQIRYLETLSSMSKNAGTKVIFMPTESNAGATTGGVTGAGGSSSKLVQAQILENYSQ
ncbi:hypothetical protein BC829DRAFT_436796 [Chytridium lagenaria]|nr:hypothetical protein BC829DRAFT_436796 [Chytridium lagenaria]